ncbi:MAG: hypothetical protein AAF525_00680 [Pseudomonadota bacterium]
MSAEDETSRVAVERGPLHKPGPMALAMLAVAVERRISFYTPMNGDDWSPDVPGLTTSQRDLRIRDFEDDCVRRGIRSWRALAKELGHDI